MIAFNRGSVPVIEDGLTGFVVEDETSAVGARQLSRLSRTVIRKRFEEQFTARRMAEQYLRLYWDLVDAASPRPKIIFV